MSSTALSDGRPLPAWITFDRIRREWSGTPVVLGLSRDDRGTFSLVYQVTDVKPDSSQTPMDTVLGSVTFTVESTAPVFTGRSLPRTLQEGSEPVAIPVMDWVDKELDSYSLSAEWLPPGAHPTPQDLPGWVSVRGTTLTAELVVTPVGAPLGVSVLRVYARDRLGARSAPMDTQVSIEAAPSVRMSLRVALLRYGLPILLSIGMLCAVVTLLVWRNDRIRATTRQVIEWSGTMRRNYVLMGGEEGALSPCTMQTLLAALDVAREKIVLGEMRQAEECFADFEEQAER